MQIQSNEIGPNVFPYRVIGHETQITEIDLQPQEGACIPVLPCVATDTNKVTDTDTDSSVVVNYVNL